MGRCKQPVSIQPPQGRVATASRKASFLSEMRLFLPGPFSVGTATAPTSCGYNCRVSVDQGPGCVSVLSSLLGELISGCGSMPSHLCICSPDVPPLWDLGTLVSQTKHLLPSHPTPIPSLVFPPEEAAHPLPGYSSQSPVGHVSILSPPTSYPSVSKPRSAPPLHHCCSFNLHRITPLHRNLQGLPRTLSVKPASSPDLKALSDQPLLTSPRHLSSGPTLSPAWFTLRRPVFYTTKQVRASLVLFPPPRIFSPSPQLTESALLFLQVSTSMPPSPRSLSAPPRLKQAFVTLYFSSCLLVCCPSPPSQCQLHEGRNCTCTRPRHCLLAW